MESMDSTEDESDEEERNVDRNKHSPTDRTNKTTETAMERDSDGDDND